MQHNLPAGGRQKPGNQTEQRTFPRAARPQYCNAFSSVNLHRKTHRQMVIEPGYIS